jgi:predicted ester cyclase
MTVHTTARILNRRTAVRLCSGGLAAALATCGPRPTRAADSATLEGNKAIARRVLEEMLNGSNAAVLEELYATDFVNRGTWTRQLQGPGGLPMKLEEFQTEFPNVTVTVDALVAEGDLVAARATWHDTHPPAGTHVVGRTMHHFRIVNGQISEQWSVGWEWLTQRDRVSTARPGNPLIVK